MAQKYRKKPVIIEAWKWTGSLETSEVQPIWIHANRDVGVKGDRLEVRTLEGTMLAMPGDWIIQGVKGELYPCKPDIFEATYEAVAA
jgi:hypothetical protein